jgi:uncharacterized small protein (DUF1192 family)
METYKNDYVKEQDELLWELHEIRHTLSKEYKEMSIDEINKRANLLWEEIKKRNKEKIPG